MAETGYNTSSIQSISFQRQYRPLSGRSTSNIPLATSNSVGQYQFATDFQNNEMLKRNQSQSNLKNLAGTSYLPKDQRFVSQPITYQYSNFGHVNQFNGYTNFTGALQNPPQIQSFVNPISQNCSPRDSYQPLYSQQASTSTQVARETHTTSLQQTYLQNPVNTNQQSTESVNTGQTNKVTPSLSGEEHQSVPSFNEKNNMIYSEAQPSQTKIDPKYVAEIESNLGKLRIENIQQRERLDVLEANQRIEADKREITAKQMERLIREAATAAQYSEKHRKAQQEADLGKKEIEAKNKILAKLQQENFHLTFNRVDYDSICRDNSILKQNLAQAHSALEDLKKQFVSYTWLVSPDAEIVEQREKGLRDLEDVRIY